MTAVEGNTAVCQVNSVNRITGEGRSELLILWTWGPGFDQERGR